MYRILLIDDEPYTLNCLSFYLIQNLHKYDIDILKASTTEAVLDVMHNQRIDIVISGIYMKTIDGFKMHEEIINKWMHCLFIFITESADIGYAQKAIRSNNIIDFILKSEDVSYIKSATEKAITLIEKTQATRHEIVKLRSQYMQSVQLIQGIYLKNMLMGKMNDLDSVRLEFHELGICLDVSAPSYVLIGRMDDIPEGFTSNDNDLLFYSICNIAKELNAGRFQFYATNYCHKLFAFILQPNDQFVTNNPMKVLQTILTNLQHNYHKLLGTSISFVMPKEPVSFYETSMYCNKFVKMLHYSNGLAKGCLLIDEEASSKPTSATKAPAFTISLLKESLIPLETALDVGNRTKFHEILDQLEASYVNSDYMTSIGIISTISAMMMKHLINLSNGNSAFEKNLHATLNGNYATWIESMNHIRKYANMIFDAIESKNQEEFGSKLLNDVDQYIDDHISEDLSLTRVANAMFHSPSYFSKLFKRITGVGFCSYVEQKRMERARYFLKSTDMRASEIASSIGYDTQAYFNKVFKSRYGITPYEYRKLKINSASKKNQPVL